MTRGKSDLDSLVELIKEITMTLEEEEDSPERSRKLKALKEKMRRGRFKLLRDVLSEQELG
jgi:hypothetical protein